MYYGFYVEFMKKVALQSFPMFLFIDSSMTHTTLYVLSRPKLNFGGQVLSLYELNPETT